MSDVKITDIQARQEFIEVQEDQVMIFSHLSTQEDGVHIVRVMFREMEIGTVGSSRGEAMLTLGEWLEEVGQKLKRMAFEQEGAIRIPK